MTNDSQDLKSQSTSQGLNAFGERSKGRTGLLSDGEMAAFVGRFRTFRNGIAEMRYDAFTTRFSKICRLMRETRIAAREEDRHIASMYNIFEILDVQQDEVRTHSAFLADLLDPNGRHAQGDLFFRSFVNALVPDSRRSLYESIGSDDYRVTKEKSISTGSIDIFIESTKRERRFAIIIENKVFALAGQNQLAKYYEWAIAKKGDGGGYRDEELLVVYLTPGREAPQKSLGNYNGEDWRKRHLLVEINYREHVRTWLENMLPEVAAEVVKAVLRQYIATLQNVGKE